MSDTVADRAVGRLWQLAWADKEHRTMLTELLLHVDIPELVAEIRRLTTLLEEVDSDRAALRQIAQRGGW